MIALAALCVALLAALVYERVNSRRERETMLKAINLAITEGTKERDALRKERQEILNRKAMGEKVPVYDVPEGEPQYLPYEDDQAWWDDKKGLNGSS